jgi:hypothetical protein
MENRNRKPNPNTANWRSQCGWFYKVSKVWSKPTFLETFDDAKLFYYNNRHNVKKCNPRLFFDGVISNWTTGLRHLRFEVSFALISLKKDSQVI